MGAKLTISTNLLGDTRVGHIANGKTIGNDETIQEAIDKGYVVGKKEVIGAQLKGVLKAMVDGITRDGDGRKIDKLFSIQPVLGGRLEDVCEELDKDKAKVWVAARLLKNGQIDTSDWSFVIEGATGTFVITSINTGENEDEIIVGEDVAINGENLTLGSGDSVAWSVPEASKSGTVAAAKLTSEATRITVTGDALSELQSATYNGMSIVWTVTIGGKKAVKAATLVVVE